LRTAVVVLQERGQKPDNVASASSDNVKFNGNRVEPKPVDVTPTERNVETKKSPAE